MNNERLQEIKALIHSWAYPVMGDEDRLIEVSIFQELIAALEACQQQLAEADVRITKLKSFLYSLRDVTTVAGAQIRRIDKIVDEAVDENSK